MLELEKGKVAAFLTPHSALRNLSSVYTIPPSTTIVWPVM